MAFTVDELLPLPFSRLVTVLGITPDFSANSLTVHSKAALAILHCFGVMSKIFTTLY